jgi:2-dehydropantoate 2-reductase
MRYAVIGTGAIGGFYGGRLMRAGNEVNFLLHTDYEYVKENGLQIDSCDGSFHLDNVKAFRSTEDMPEVDVVLVCLKSTREHLLKEMLPPLIKNNPLVVLIQNGIGLEDDLQALFPELQIAAGLAFICSGKVGPGHIDHQCYGSINIGNFSCHDASLMEHFLEELKAAGIEANPVEYLEARWKKAVWNMPFNGMTVALNTTTNKLLENPSTRQLIRDQMMEVVGASRALGVKGVDEAFVEKMIQMTDEMTPYKPSMKLDYDFHRPMEIDYLYSKGIRQAREAGYTMHKLEMLEQELRFLEECNRLHEVNG